MGMSLENKQDTLIRLLDNLRMSRNKVDWAFNDDLSEIKSKIDDVEHAIVDKLNELYTVSETVKEKG